MDPLQVETQLRNTFLTLLGGDMSIFEGQKQQMQQRFNNESRQVAINMINQIQAQARPINMADYQNVALQLLNTYKSTTPAPQMYAGQMQSVAPMYMGQPMQPAYAMMPAMGQQVYMAPQPQQFIPQQRFAGNLTYTPAVRPMYQTEPAYQPVAQTMISTAPSKNLYAGALPANAQQPQQIQVPQQQYAPPMSTVQKTVTPINVNDNAPLVQPATSTYSMPTIIKSKIFQIKSPYVVKGNVLTYQNDDGTQIHTIVGNVTSPVPDIAGVAKTLAKKESASDITLSYTPYELIAGDLKDMQDSFLAVKKIISNGIAANAAPSAIVSNIVDFCDTKTKGVAKRIENIIMDAYSAYVFVANNNDDGVVIPEADELECLQAPGSATMELCIRKALKEFEQCSIYDPASSQLAAFLKEIDLGIPETYNELKKNKAGFAEWAKTHCVLKKPVEAYRITTVDHTVTNIDRMFGFRSDTPPDDELEFFTVEGIKQSIARKITMVIQTGKSSVTCTGSVSHDSDIIHVEFQ